MSVGDEELNVLRRQAEAALDRPMDIAFLLERLNRRLPAPAHDVHLLYATSHRTLNVTQAAAAPPTAPNPANGSGGGRGASWGYPKWEYKACTGRLPKGVWVLAG